MELFTNFEIIIMVSVVGFLLLVILILSVMEILSRRKEKINLESEAPRVEQEEIELEKEELEEDFRENFTEDNDDDDLGELVISKIEDINDIQESNEIQESNQEKEFTSNVIELKNDLFEEVVETEKKEISKVVPDEILIEDIDTPIVQLDNNDVEILELEPSPAELELLKVKEELEHPLSLEDTISNLEKEEEEGAIISYQELLDVTSEMQVIEDLEDEPISITEVYERFTGERVEHPSVDDLYQASLVNPESDLNEIQLENTANLEKLDKEIRKTNKVLNMLNELKKNLD